ncbi:MAG: tRNA preQ1(34) S-adenosylmethionine ribosyltransferase-isomerase QueA [Spirochaetales bacterium]|nr:tRNA preQ1(34) S-adenosylmethionine ribosyltransferase-isomerase QueA [Spirochaetales bacterium]
MKTRDFSFDLPDRLIAQYPTQKRGTSRLMVVDRKTRKIQDSLITHLKNYLLPGSLLVLNNTRVRKARFYGVSETQGKVEFVFLERKEKNLWKVLVNKSRKQRKGKRFVFPGGVEAVIEEGAGNIKWIRLSREVDEAWFENNGHMPLPPYIKREDQELDTERYQTVYSRIPGSAAAPTAGLHFTDELLDGLKDSGIDIYYLSLNVGLGTFLPIRSENIEDHVMHEEEYTIPCETADAVNTARQEGKPVVAVGTTVVRALESACEEGDVKSGTFRTGIYIYPGYNFKAVSSMLTNFHIPESTLLLLVSAFAGTNLIRGAYREAIEKEYRFFSYGDAMLVL